MPLTTEIRFIEAAEAVLGAKLPTSFREYLLKNNGGEMVIMGILWELNSVFDTSDEERIRRTSIDIIKETASAREWRDFPRKAVSIGSDGSGNYLVFLPDEHDVSSLNPTLLIWWHEGSELEIAANDFGEL